MKKFLCLFLTVVMLLSISVCAVGCSTEDVRGSIVDKNDNQNETEPEFSLGKTAGGTYHNAFLGISCMLPEEWEFYTDEQILELNNIVGEYLDEELYEQLKNANVIYDMYAQYPAEGSSMNIILEKLNAIQIAALNIKQILEAQLPGIESGYKNMGYTDVKVEYQKIKVDGKELDGLRLSAKIQGIDFCAVVFAFRKSNYLANITVATLQTDKMEEMLSYFTMQ